MNNYDLSKIETPKSTEGGVSPYMTYGGPQVLKINSIELKYSQNSHAPRAIFHMETKPIEETGFTPVENAKGRVGKVACGVYMNTDNLKHEFLQKLKIIATILGLESEANKIRSESFEKAVEDVANLIKGRYAKYTIFASEYPKDGGRVGITLSLPKFRFVESEDANPSTIVVFNKENAFHYKKINGTGNNSSTYAQGKYGGATTNITGSKYGNYEDHIPDNPTDPDVNDLPF